MIEYTEWKSTTNKKFERTFSLKAKQTTLENLQYKVENELMRQISQLSRVSTAATNIADV
jgi:hypothetical protein